MEFEAPSQYERDLRAANQEWKRKKDSASKWQYGEGPASGCRWDLLTNGPSGGTDGQQRKVRPVTPGWKDPRVHNNVVKLHRSSNYGNSLSQVGSKMRIHEELEASRSSSGDALGSDLLPSPGPASDPFLYSFDRSTTPGRPLTLDVFVKAPTARDTEKLVEKEYEVVDENGRALKGRDAKRNLRQSGSGLAAERSVDDGFELV